MVEARALGVVRGWKVRLREVSGDCEKKGLVFEWALIVIGIGSVKRLRGEKSETEAAEVTSPLDFDCAARLVQDRRER